MGDRGSQNRRRPLPGHKITHGYIFAGHFDRRNLKLLGQVTFLVCQSIGDTFIRRSLVQTSELQTLNSVPFVNSNLAISASPNLYTR